MKKMLFNIGDLYMTRGVNEEIEIIEIQLALNRYLKGDWGNVCKEDKETNDYALKNGERLLASYTSSKGIDFWIITEWDRKTTTVLLPSEY